MHRTARRLLPSFGLAFALLLSACSPGGESPLVVALKPHKDPDRMLAERERLESFLQERIGREVDVVVPSSSQVIIEGMKGGTIDLAYLSSSDLARNRDTASLLLVGEIDGKTSYESYWVAKKDAQLGSIEELRGKPVCFASRTSTSGFVVPLWHLHKRGLIAEEGRPEDFFGQGNVLFGTGYVSAIEKVLAGEAVAAAVSAYVLDGNEHLADEVRSGLAIVDRQGPVPTHVLATRSDLDPKQRDALRDALLAMDSEEHRKLREALFVSRLVQVETEDHLAELAPAIEFAKRYADRQ
jgi:phosphonate transport system substrate-binding protein